MSGHDVSTALAGEPISLREHRMRQVTTERVLTAIIWGLGIPLVLGWLLLLLTIADIWTASHALGSAKAIWISHS
jgi:hypothetical protein